MPILFGLPNVVLAELCAYLELIDIVRAFDRVSRSASAKLPKLFLQKRQLELRVNRQTKRLLLDYSLPKTIIQRLPSHLIRLNCSVNNDELEGGRNVDDLLQLACPILLSFATIDRLELHTALFTQYSGSVLSSVLQLHSLRNVRYLHLGRSMVMQSFTLDLSSLYFPNLLEFQCDVSSLCFSGGLEFLASHSTLTSLAFTPDFVDISMLTSLFANDAKLPYLRSLIIFHKYCATFNAVPLIEAMSATRMCKTGQCRPLDMLKLQICCAPGVIRAASTLIHLNTLEVYGANPLWADEFISLPSSAFSHLHTFHYSDWSGSTDDQWPPNLLSLNNQAMYLAFLQTISQLPVTSLRVDVPPGVQIDNNALQYLVALNQLTLNCSEFVGGCQTIVWLPNQAVFSQLTSLSLMSFCLTREQLISIVCTTPKLEVFDAAGGHDLHSFVATLIIGQHCRQIRQILFVDYDGPGWMEYRQPLGCGHDYPIVQVKDLIQSSEEESLGDLFNHLSTLEVLLCRCTSSSVLSAFMSLFRSSSQLHCVQSFYPSDLASIMALAWLPGLQSLNLKESPSSWPDCVHVMLSCHPETADTDPVSTYTIPVGCNARPVLSAFTPKPQALISRSNTCNDSMYQMRIDDNMEHSLFRFREDPVRNGLDGRQSFFEDMSAIASQPAR